MLFIGGGSMYRGRMVTEQQLVFAALEEYG